METDTSEFCNAPVSLARGMRPAVKYTPKILNSALGASSAVSESARNSDSRELAASRNVEQV